MNTDIETMMTGRHHKSQQYTAGRKDLATELIDICKKAPPNKDGFLDAYGVILIALGEVLKE